MRHAVFVAVVALAALVPRSARMQDAPLPAREPFFTAARDNLARAMREQWHYAYKERRTDLHTNPFGKIGTDGLSVYEVVPGPEPGITFRKLIEKNGKPVTGAAFEKQDRRIKPQNRTAVDDVIETLVFDIARREPLAGRETVVVTFAAKPNAKPQTREGRIAKVFSGLIWVTEAEREVARVEATALDDMSFGFGIIARLNEGTKVTLVRERIDEGIWMPTSIRMIGEGRALLFRKLTIDYRIDWFDYRRAPAVEPQ